MENTNNTFEPGNHPVQYRHGPVAITVNKETLGAGVSIDSGKPGFTPVSFGLSPDAQLSLWRALTLSMSERFGHGWWDHAECLLKKEEEK